MTDENQKVESKLLTSPLNNDEKDVSETYEIPEVISSNYGLSTAVKRRELQTPPGNNTIDRTTSMLNCTSFLEHT